MAWRDDPEAKLRIWAENPVVVTMPPPPPIPAFSKRSFRSYDELARFKEEIRTFWARAAREAW